MNTAHTNFPGRTVSQEQIATTSESIVSAYPIHSGRHLGRLIMIGAVIALLGVLSASALAANPAEEMLKPAPITGGMDPHGDSLQSIKNSVLQFGHIHFILRLFFSLSLSVACAWVVGWHPRRSTLGDPLSDLEERKALLILGMVGSIVAELSSSNNTLAFVIFGIGALLRFRTVLDNPKLTGKAITVVVIGLACGMGSWAMAVFVTGFSWLLVFWLESHVGCRIRVRLGADVDPQPVYGAVQALLVSRHCRLQSSVLNEDKAQMTFLVLIPSALDPKQLESELRAQLPEPDEARITIEAA